MATMCYTHRGVSHTTGGGSHSFGGPGRTGLKRKPLSVDRMPIIIPFGLGQTTF